MDHATCLVSESLKRQFQQGNFDVIEVAPVPSGDRVLRLKALQEILVSLSDPVEPQCREYLVRVKQKDYSQTMPEINQQKVESAGQKLQLGEIYLPTGKLNIPYLIKNGDLLFESGDFQLARKIYNTILRSGEMTAAILNRLGKCYEAEGKLEVALAKYEEATFFQMESLPAQSTHFNDKIQKSRSTPLQARR